MGFSPPCPSEPRCTETSQLLLYDKSNMQGTRNGSAHLRQTTEKHCLYFTQQLFDVVTQAVEEDKANTMATDFKGTCRHKHHLKKPRGEAMAGTISVSKSGDHFRMRGMLSCAYRRHTHVGFE